MRTEGDAILSVQRWAGGADGFLPEPWDVRLIVEEGQEPERPYALVEYVDSAVTAGSRNLQEVTVAATVHCFLPRAASRAAADDAALALREQVFRAAKFGPDLRRPTPDRIPLYAYEPRSEVQRVSVRGATDGEWTLTFDSETTSAIAHDATEAEVQAALDVIEEDNTLVVARGQQVFDVIFVGALAGEHVDQLELDDSALDGTGSVRVILEGAPAPWRGPSDFMRVLSFGQSTVRDPDDPTLVMVAVDLRCTFARGLPLPFDQMLLQRISATSGCGG